MFLRACHHKTGQWRFASSRLKTICARQGATAAAPVLAAAEQEQQHQQQQEQEAPVDACGRPVLLKSAEDLAEAFWRDSKKGKALMHEVRCVCVEQLQSI